MKSYFPTTPCTKIHNSTGRPNVGALELANNHKLHPRTKYLALQLHHFHHCVLGKKAIAEKIGTEHQSADVFSKALPRDGFKHLQSKISGWQDFVWECRGHIIHDGTHKFPQCIM